MGTADLTRAERRKQESCKLLEKYPDRIPVLIERSNVETDLTALQQTKFLIPVDFTFQQLQQVIRKRLTLDKTKSLYIYFSKNRLVQNGKFGRAEGPMKSEVTD